MNQKETDRYFLQQAIDLAVENVKKREGGPFAALIVKDNKVIASGTNVVSTQNDPTAHAEISAIRNACQKINDFKLEGCTIYSSCEPCPMCLGSIYWARLNRLVFAANKKQAAEAGFDDDFIYKEFELDYNNRSISTSQQMQEEGYIPFKLWIEDEHKTTY